jgi:hypothetical protein
MDLLRDQRVLAFGGAAAVLVVAMGVAVWLAMADDGSDPDPPPPGQGLTVQVGRTADPKLDASRPLRCFVNGLPVGEMPVADCARRNGVVPGAMSVGIDTTGSLAAAKGPTTEIVPLPPASSPQDLGMPDPVDTADASPPAPPAPEADGSPGAAQVASDAAAPSGARGCWRYQSGDWQESSGQVSLGECARALFAGQCVMPGEALYGRWGNRTLRLTPDGVELSSDSRSFRILTRRRGACANAGPF